MKLITKLFCLVLCGGKFLAKTFFIVAEMPGQSVGPG